MNQPVPEREVNKLSKALGCGEHLATILHRRRFGSEREVRRFLFPRLSSLADPFSLTGMRPLVARIELALRNRERVHVFGDYDVDGVSSTVIMVDYLGSLGGLITHSVPRRSEEGYGLTTAHVEKVLAENAVDLWIALDCGSNAHLAVALLKEAGVDVLIIDHHQLRTTAPESVIMVNPHAEKGGTGVHLCTASLVFKFAQAMESYLRERGESRGEEATRLKDYLDLVALATVTDLVPLVDENRVLVHFGLQRLGRSKRPGIQALMDVCGLPYGRSLDASDISYKLGPRINAGGRLNDAMLSVNLLLSSHFNDCVRAACELEAMNQERQAIEKQVFLGAMDQIASTGCSNRAGFVLYDASWHTGVVGIVSNRLAKTFERPVVVLGNEGRIAKGSCRGIDGVDLVSVLDICGGCLIEWGGHPMAVGLSLDPRDVGGFAEAFDVAVADAQARLHGVVKSPDSGASLPLVEVDLWLRKEEIAKPLIEELNRLGPFGVGNPEPVLGLRSVPVSHPPVRFGGEHYKFWVGLENRDYDLMCLSWNGASNIPLKNRSIDLLFHLKWHEWRGRGYPEATLVDWRYCD